MTPLPTETPTPRFGNVAAKSFESAFNRVAMILGIPEEAICDTRIPFETIKQRTLNTLQLLITDKNQLAEWHVQMTKHATQLQSERDVLKQEVEHQTRRAEKAEASIGVAGERLDRMDKRIAALEQRLSAENAIGIVKGPKTHTPGFDLPFAHFRPGDKVTIMLETAHARHGTIRNLYNIGAWLDVEGSPMNPCFYDLKHLKKGWE